MAISLQRLTIFLYSAHRAVIFAIAQLSCCMIHPCNGRTDRRTDGRTGALYVIEYSALSIYAMLSSAKNYVIYTPRKCTQTVSR